MITKLMKNTLLFSLLITLNASLQAQLVKTGDSIAFLGDSITQYGNLPGGYIQLVVSGLQANGIKVKSYPAGIAGHMSNHMLKRLDYAVLKHKPTWMTLSCGVNDVRHRTKGIPLEQYKQNVTAIIERAKKAGIKVMVLTATMIFEDSNHAFNKKLALYNEFLRQVAAEKQCVLADLNTEMQREVDKFRKNATCSKFFLTRDGVHMNQLGNRMMAYGILKAFGLNSEQLKKAKNTWKNKAGSFRWLAYGFTQLTLEEREKLQHICEAKKVSLSQLLTPLINNHIKKLLTKSVASYQTSNNALIPAGKLEKDFYDWDQRHSNITQKVKDKKFDIVFIGDSITHHFEATKLWKEKLEPFKALNLGFGWDRTQNVIWRLEHGELKDQHPELIILNIGTNNFSGTKNARANSPKEVVEAIHKILAILQQKAPKAHLLVMGVFPRGNSTSWNYQAINILNSILKKELIDIPNVTFMNIAKKFLTPNGSLNRNLYKTDMVHLTDKGYAVWLTAIQPIINQYQKNIHHE